MELLFVSATPFEAEGLLSRGKEPFSFRGRRGVLGEGWRWLELGVGKVNAAMTLAAYLEAEARPFRVVVIGIGGAYPQSGLRPGEVAVASLELQADLGTKRGLEPLGFPALVVKGKKLYNRFPPDPALTAFVSERLGKRPVPFLTADLVSESFEEAYERFRRWRAAVENMEGAAVAQVALWRGLPWAEVRGISNLAGERRRSAWRTDEALSRLWAELIKLL